MNSPARESLRSVLPPEGDHAARWPVEAMNGITPRPTTWVTIVRQEGGPDADVRSCSLVYPDHVASELARDAFRTRDVGEVEIFGGRFHDGMTDFRDGHLEFFCQVRSDPLEEPAVDWSLPFLWYWNAFRRGDAWVYRDEAGRDVELARLSRIGDDVLQVEVQAMALRRYLHLIDRRLLISFDITSNFDDDLDQDDREEYTGSRSWTSAELSVYAWRSTGGDARTGVWLHGQYVIEPAAGGPEPTRFAQEPTESGAGLEFTYAIDDETGRPLTATPTVENTGTDGALGPRAFTRVYFQPQVLERYTSEPARYTVTASRVWCLNVWSLSIGRTSDGMVEVDLYDLRGLARSELQHWLAYNVAPSGGKPDEGKIRREQLNIPAASPDSVHELKAALENANAAATRLFGRPLWRELTGQSLTEWNALHPPVGDDRTALMQPLLTLTKGLCDSIDHKLITDRLDTAPPPNTGSLVRLRSFLQQIGGGQAELSPFFDLQDARSRGGFAHPAGRSTDRAIEALAPGRTRPADIFNEAAGRLTISLRSIADLLQAAADAGDGAKST